MTSVTVVLCTYNRCESLATTLSSLAELTVQEPVDWEILVVDNNSSDRTPRVVDEFCRRDPSRFRYVFERQQGLSFARNAGIRDARGDIIAFTDDDVTVEPTWLQNLTKSLRDGQWAGAGGRVVPVWSCSRPAWLPRTGPYALAPLTMFDIGPDAGQLAEPPFGANMAFRKQMFEKYGVFRTDLGRCGESMISNEDTEFGGRLVAAGEPLRYEPSAIVYHPVAENRLQKKYFLAWWYGKGRSDIRQLGVRPNTKYYLSGVPLCLFRNLAMRTLRWITTVEPFRRFELKLKVWAKAGEISECYLQPLAASPRLQHQNRTYASPLVSTDQRNDVRFS